MNIKHIFLISVVSILFSCNAEKKTQNTINEEDKKLKVLLIGTSHWNNYQSEGLDVAKTNEIDILSGKYQKELEQLSIKIAEFRPTKIFAERTLGYQPKLDSLYTLYRTSDWGKDRRNEIYQLGFRVAARLNHKKVYGIDYWNTSFPYDSLLIAMKEANQKNLKNEFEQDIKNFENDYNKLVQQGKSLVEILNFFNAEEQRRSDLGWYLNGANRGGVIENDIGSFLASEWIKRNIYSYGMIQKYIEEDDNRIMILMGASHIAVLENLISYNPDWKIVELKEIIDKPVIKPTFGLSSQNWK